MIFCPKRKMGERQGTIQNTNTTQYEQPQTPYLPRRSSVSGERSTCQAGRRQELAASTRVFLVTQCIVHLTRSCFPRKTGIHSTPVAAIAHPIHHWNASSLSLGEYEAMGKEKKKKKTAGVGTSSDHQSAFVLPLCPKRPSLRPPTVSSSRK